jgi:hypothetical protein
MSFLWIGLVVLGSWPDSLRVVCPTFKSGLQVLFAFFLFFCQITADMRSEPNLTATLTIRLTPEMKGYLKERARREHRKMSNVVYTIIDDAIQQDQIRLPDPSPVMPQVVLSRNQPDAAHGEQMDKA